MGTSYLKCFMIDWSVGIGDDRIQRWLLSELDLTFDKVLKLAQAIETASKDVKDLQSLELAPPHVRNPQSVHKLSARQSSIKNQTKA